MRIGSSSTSATEYYPFTDNVNSIRNLVKADGTLLNNFSYSAYGSTLTATEATGASQPYRFSGGYTDSPTGLVKLGARYYDATQGRFTQTDPSGQDPHYSYAAQAPQAFGDPTGLRTDYCGGQNWTRHTPEFIFFPACAVHDACYSPRS